MPRLTPLPVLLVALALSRPAWAQTPADSPKPVPSTSAVAVGPAEAPVEYWTTPSIGRRWYGWQILGADALSLSLFVAGAGTSATSPGSPPSSPLIERPLVDVGASGYVLGSALIHLAHGRIGAAAGSFALRLVLPEAGFLLGRSLDTCPVPNLSEHSECGIVGPLFGVIAGVISASLIDAIAFPWAKSEPEKASQVHLGWSPVLSAHGTRGELRSGSVSTTRGRAKARPA